MASTLERLGAVRTGPIGASNFVKPQGIFYELDGKERKWVSAPFHLAACCAMRFAVKHNAMEWLAVYLWSVQP